MATPEEYAAAVKRFKDQNWQNGGTTVTPTTGAQNLAAVGAQSGVDPNKGAQYKAAVEGFKAANWQNGGTTVTPTTGAQNLANVFNQQGNTLPITPYIQSQLDQAKIDTANQSQGGGGVATAAGSVGQGGSQPTDSGLGNAQDYINQLNDLRKNSALSALQKSHDTALSNMGAEKSAIQPKYYDARNATAAGAQQQARNFAEYMAQRGGSAGTAGQATLSNNLTTQGNLSNLGRQEAAAYTDIARRTSDLNNSYQSDIATTTANAEADKMSALLQDYYSAQTRGDTKAQNAIQNAMAEANLTGQYNGGQTIASKQADASNKLVEAGLTGTLNGQQTLAAKQLDRSNFESDRSYNLAKATQDWTQTFQKEQYTDQKAQQIWENTFKDKSFMQSMKDAAASRGLQWASLNQRDKEFVADQTFKEKAFTADQEQRGIANTLNQDQLDWQKNPLNPSNASKTPSGGFNLDDYKGFINQSFYKDVPANPSIPFDKSTVKQLDTVATRKYIIGLNLPDSETDQMLKLYKLPTN